MYKIKKNIVVAILSVILVFFLTAIVNQDYQEKNHYGNLTGKEFQILEVPDSFDQNLTSEILNLADRNNIILERTGQINIDDEQYAIKYYSFTSIEKFNPYLHFELINPQGNILSTQDLESENFAGLINDFLHNDTENFGLLDNYFQYNQPRGLYRAYYNHEQDFKSLTTDLATLANIDASEFQSTITVNTNNPLELMNPIFIGIISFLYITLFIVISFDFINKSKTFAVSTLLGTSKFKINIKYLKNINLILILSCFLCFLISIIILRPLNIAFLLSLTFYFLVAIVLTNLTVLISSLIINDNNLSNILKKKKVTGKILFLNSVVHIISIGTITIALFVLVAQTKDLNLLKNKFESFEDYNTLSVIYDFDPGNDGSIFSVSDEFDQSQTKLYQRLYEKSPETTLYADFQIFNCKWITDRPCYAGNYYKGIVNDSYLKSFVPQLWSENLNATNTLFIPSKQKDETDAILQEAIEEYEISDFQLQYYEDTLFPTLSPNIAEPDNYKIENPIFILLTPHNLDHFQLSSVGNNYNTPMKLIINNKLEWYEDNLDILKSLELDDNIGVKNFDSITTMFTETINSYQQTLLFVNLIAFATLVIYVSSNYHYVRIYVQDNLKNIAVQEMLGYSFTRRSKEILSISLGSSLIIMMLISLLANFEMLTVLDKVLTLFFIILLELTTLLFLFKHFSKNSIIKVLKGE